jgi:RimJ/RimL family protein N-acetyltransferase
MPRRPGTDEHRAQVRAPYRARRYRLHDGREVTLRAIDANDGPKITQAFERLSAESRYSRFMQHKKQLDPAALERGVNPRPGKDFAFVATVPAKDSVEIVGAAQYVRIEGSNPASCEFAITLAEGWRGAGLAARLLGSLIRRARRDDYDRMEGRVLASNSKMLALARRFRFAIREASDDPAVLQIVRTL